MNAVGILLSLLLLLLPAVTLGYINNFRFKHSNVFTNNVLPFKVRITGSYYIDLAGTPELSYLKNQMLGGAVKASSLANSNLPVVCTGNTAGLIAELNATAHNGLTDKLTDLELLIGKRGSTVADVVAQLKKWGPYVNVDNPDYDCHKLPVTPAATTDGAFSFTLDVLFNDYKSIVFVDAMGVGLFVYKRSYDTKHSGHTSGNPIRFCGGVEYTGDMYTIEPRPKCPTSTPESSRHYGRAIITVYKPNIVSFRWNATRCIQTVTHVHAYENIFGGSRDSWVKHRVAETTQDECREWNRTLSACDAFKVRAIKENDVLPDGLFGYYGYYDNHPEECSIEPIKSQNNAVNEFRSNPDLQYKFSGGDVNAYDKRMVTLSRGFIEVSMPTGTMVSPWMNIPTETQKKGYYSYNNVTVIWDPIPDAKMCKYVPRFRSEVAYIKYKHGDSEISPEDDTEGYTMFLLADKYGAMFTVDSSQKVEDISAFDCMPHKADYRTTLYQANSDQIIMVTRVDDGGKSGHAESHIPEDVRHEGLDEQVHGGYESITFDVRNKKVMAVQHDNELTAIKPSIVGNDTITHDLRDHFSTVKATRNARPDPPPIPTKPMQSEVLNYINYKRAKTQRHNLHVRAMQSCFINQLDWDVYVQLMDLNPSRALSNRLNMALEASLGGNGFYNVKRCELAVDLVVVPTLRTNSKEKVSVNGKEYAVSQIVEHMGVKPDPEKCFVMPLLVFTSPLTGIQVVGQLTLEGIINPQKLAYLEACGRNKAHVFMINDYGHFFYDYVKNFTETADVIRNATDRFLRASNPILLASGQELTQEQIQNHSLSKIHTLSIVQPTNLKEKEYKHYPTGLYNNDIFNLAEHQSISLGLMKLMEEQNFERFATREFTADFNEGLSSSDAGLFAGAGNFVSGAGDFFMKVGQGGGALLYGLGGGIGKAVKGAGEGVGKAGKGIFDGIGDALKGTFTALAIPLIAVVILAIIAVVVYKQLTGKKTPPTPEDPPPPYTPHSQYAGVTWRQGFNFDQ